MSKLIKIVVMAFTIASLCAPAWAVVDRSSLPIDVTATMPFIAGDVTLTISQEAGGIAFNPATATLANPWVRSTGYVRVVYSSTSNAPYVGVRIVSKNAELTDLAPGDPPPVDADLDGDIDIDDYIAAALMDPNNDGVADKKGYGGMIFNADLDAGRANEDPSKRVVLAWQVFNAPVVAPDVITVPTSSVVDYTDPLGVRASGKELKDENNPALDTSVGLWDTAWAYIGDVSDEGFLDSVWDATTGGITSPVIVSGFSSGTDNGFLAQHPRIYDPATGLYTDRTADGDICVYSAARFANTNWGSTLTAAPRARLLPTGDYRVRLYVELIHDL